jgi:DnaJ-class molecular chaperone
VTVTLEEAHAGTSRMVDVPGDPFSGSPGKRLEVLIPAGVKTGSRVHIGPQATGGAVDLNLDVTVAPHATFERKGDDLHTVVEVPLADLVLGGEVEVPTIGGKRVALKVPPETQNARVFRLKGKGMPKQGQPSSHGDELVEVRAVIPQHLTPEQRQFFEKLRAAGAGR